MPQYPPHVAEMLEFLEANIDEAGLSFQVEQRWFVRCFNARGLCIDMRNLPAEPTT